MSCLHILDFNPLLIIKSEDTFYLLFRLSSHFVDGFLCCGKVFKFNYVTYVYFCFCLFYLMGHIKNKKNCHDFCQRVFCQCSLGFVYFVVLQLGL